MAILQVAGEDIDFGGASVIVDTSAGDFRAGLARCGIRSNYGGVHLKSLPFQGGGVTSCWLSFYNAFNNATVGFTGLLICGLVDNTTTSSGLWLGIDSSDYSKLALYMFDGTTATELASYVSGFFLHTGLTFYRCDIQVTGYGSSGCTVNVYINGILAMTYTGTISPGGSTSLSCIGLYGYLSAGFATCSCSEMIAASQDTRALGLFTMAPTGAGNTDAWSGTYSGVDGATYSDGSPVYSNTAAQNEDFTLSSSPPGNYSVLEVIRNVRAAKTVGSTTNDVALGFYIGSTHYNGTPQAVTTAFALYQQFYVDSPATSTTWTFGSLATLQANLESS